MQILLESTDPRARPFVGQPMLLNWLKANGFCPDDVYAATIDTETVTITAELYHRDEDGHLVVEGKDPLMDRVTRPLVVPLPETIASALAVAYS